MAEASTPSERYQYLFDLNMLAIQLYSKWEGGQSFPLAAVREDESDTIDSTAQYNPAIRINGLIKKLDESNHFRVYMAALRVFTNEALDTRLRVIANQATNQDKFYQAMETLDRCGYQMLEPGQKIQHAFLTMRGRLISFTPQQLADLKEYYMYWEEDPVSKDEWLGKLTKLESHLNESFYRGLEVTVPRFREDENLAK